MLISWAPDHDKLERCHDYIQILFPLPEGSMFSYNAPIINKRIMEAFRSRTYLRMNLSHAFILMLDFYGFETESSLGWARPKKQREEHAAAQDIASTNQAKQWRGKGKGKATEVDGESDTISQPSQAVRHS
jgi:hypothetical protein